MALADANETAAALADELRAIGVALTLHETSDEGVAAALPLARQLRALLEGPRRQRWYDHDPVSPISSPGARASYGDQSPIRGQRNPVAPPLVLERVEGPAGPRMRGTVTFSRAYEGPPHGVHGGFVAALFDEMLGAAQGLAPPPGVTALLEIRYRNVTPVEEPLRFEAWIADERERRIEARATCHAGDTLTADARGTFVRVDFEAVQQRMAERRGGATK